MKLRRLLLSVAVVLGVMAPVAAAPGAACAASGSSAALVIDTGGQTLKYCVAISGSVSGIDLIKAASKQYGLNYSLGYGGQGVCTLAGVGTSSNDCLRDDKPYFWGYWRGTGGGGWSWSSSGAAGTTVSPGDVEGWAWGTGMDSSSHPQPPNTDYEDVCKVDTGGGGGDSGGGGHDHNGGGGSNDNTTSSDTTNLGDSSGAGSGDNKNRTTSDNSTSGDQKNHDNTTDETNKHTDSADTTDTTRVHRHERTDATAETDIGATSTEATQDQASPGAAPLAVGSTPPNGSRGPPVLGWVALIGGLILGAWGFVMAKRRDQGTHRPGSGGRGSGRG